MQEFNRLLNNDQYYFITKRAYNTIHWIYNTFIQ